MAEQVLVTAYTMLRENEEAKKAALEKKKLCKCGDIEKREGITIYKTDRRLAKTATSKNSQHPTAFTLFYLCLTPAHPRPGIQTTADEPLIPGLPYLM